MRSYRDLWLWLGGLFLALVPFPAAIAIASYAKLTNYSVLLNRWMLVSLAFFLAAFACFFGAIKGLRFPPWKKITFPDIKIHVYGAGFEVVERVITVPGASSNLVTKETLWLFMVRIVNMEAEQNASLTVRLYAKLVPGSFDDVLEMVCTPPDWSLSPDLGLNPIQMPFVLEPGNTVGGHLPYVMPPFLKFASPPSGHLELEDHVTGKRVLIPAQMGADAFDKRTMVPSSHGIPIPEERYRTLAWPPMPFEGVVRFFRNIFPPL
jgi:hypothetical protein